VPLYEQCALWQQTDPPQLWSGVQRMEQVSPAHETDVAQLPNPEHLSSAVPLPWTAPPHELGPPQVTLHSEGAPRHETPPTHALLPMHDSSHWSALQLTRRAQVFCSRHPTLHRVPAHWTIPLQLPVPLQVMSHFVADEQSTPSAQLPELEQATRHGKPGGHTTRLLHGRESSQRMTHSPAAHVPSPFASHSLTQSASAARPSASDREAASPRESAVATESGADEASTAASASGVSATLAS
jgi:hypothetical protein